MSSDKLQCFTCRWFKLVGIVRGDGECHRLPPTHEGWPPSDTTEFCAEHSDGPYKGDNDE